MQNFVYTVTDPEGLHARPAGLLVKCAQSCGSDVKITLNGRTADAKRLFAVMGLCVKQNDQMAFAVEGSDEAADCEKLKAFCEANL
ncbi:MAG: HPr family phosphocarrier protein [Clostridiales bacterium]|jgi:phosphotransferase system HPr (HPr) family protein|nr:HPr family phosphocarrier protein [Clostridiales bacterium]